MNVKKIGNLVFYIVGTCILISVSIVVFVNILNDARLFGDSYNQVNSTRSSQSATGDPNSEAFDTLKYNRTFTPDAFLEEADKKAKVTITPTPVAALTSLKGVSVELISYIKVEGVAESFKETMENQGCVVTFTKPRSKNAYTTRIIEHNNKGAGILLMKVLKSGVIIKDYSDTNDPKVPTDLYSYDLTVILGEDYNP